MINIQIEIITPNKVEYKGEISSVTIPGTVGNFQVLTNHAPILSSFETGVIKIITLKDEEIYFATGGGTVEVLKNSIRVLADSLESPENIDIERAKDALDRAKNKLKNTKATENELEEARSASERAKNRINLVNKLSSKGILNN